MEHLQYSGNSSIFVCILDDNSSRMIGLNAISATSSSKEHCYRGSNATALWSYFEELSVITKNATKLHNESAIILSGCVDIKANMRIFQYLHKPKTKYIVMTRDFAELLWAGNQFL